MATVYRNIYISKENITASHMATVYWTLSVNKETQMSHTWPQHIEHSI
jgi:hypothetical protein